MAEITKGPANMLDRLRSLDFLSELDVHFARFIASLTEKPSEEFLVGMAMASRHVREGHVCVNLEEFAGRAPDIESGEDLVLPDLKRWTSHLRSSSVVGEPGDYTPLILDNANRLYLQRYWLYEDRLAHRIKGLVSHPAREPRQIEPARLREALNRHFPAAGDEPDDTQGDSPKPVDYQRLAALTVVLKRFSVVSGGPGTGKTWLVSRILPLLEDLAGRETTVALTAPTGKAAARLLEAVKSSVSPETSEGTERQRWEGSTVHRLLMRLSRDPAYRPDLVVVDEASMADLALMSRLMTSLPAETRVLWLGDKDQLSSVEAGAVLGDVCGPSETMGHTQEFVKEVFEIDGMRLESDDGAEGTFRDNVVLLRKSYRFSESGGIGAVSAAINRGDYKEALGLMKSEEAIDVQWMDPDSMDNWEHRFAERIVRGFGPFIESRSVEEAFSNFSRFRVLCSHRRGPLGVTNLNRAIETWLESAGLIESYQQWYRNRPLLITKNDYRMSLYNGDTGLILSDPDRAQELSTVFQPSAGKQRWIPPALLPEHETVYAMTVHKSQGSEFREVVLLLPDRESPLLTRELLYTAITRAIERVEIWGREEVFRAAVSQKIRRRSGLRDALWGSSPETA